MNYIDRNIFKDLKRHLSLKQITILTGLRLSKILKLKNSKVVVKNIPKDFSEFIWGGDFL